METLALVLAVLAAFAALGWVLAPLFTREPRDGPR
jgi:hypothetical protein